jgi:hypothetical protein
MEISHDVEETICFLDDGEVPPQVGAGNIFHCPNGVILVITRESLTGHHFIHVSAQIDDELRNRFRLLNLNQGKSPLTELVEQSQAAFVFVAMISLSNNPNSWSGPVPHWYIPIGQVIKETQNAKSG